MVSLKDIAQIVGCDTSTVSRALNDSKEVSDETKMAIKKIAKELNYTPNYSARALVGKGMNTIGVVVPEFSSNHFAQLIGYIEMILKQNNFFLFVGISHHQLANEIECINNMLSRGVDGILLAFPIYSKLQEFLMKIREKSNIPIVTTQPQASLSEIDCVMVDDDYGYDLLMKHIANRGHKDLGFVGDRISTNLRLGPCLRAAEKYGMKLDKKHIVIEKPMYEKGGYVAMSKLLEQPGPLPTAVIASYDDIAIGAAKAILDHNLRIPEDISICGYDNIKESAYLACPLTTIAPPYFEMAQLSTKMLLEQIRTKEQKPRQHIQLNPSLVIRDSIAKIK
jgi:LacI family transcriptional regulator